jgi:hypothetical protein
MKHAQMWNRVTNGGNNLCHKSSRQTKSSTTPVYTDKWRISETNFVRTARTRLLMFICPLGLVLASTVTIVGVNNLRFIHEKRAVCGKGCTLPLVASGLRICSCLTYKYWTAIVWSCKRFLCSRFLGPHSVITCVPDTSAKDLSRSVYYCSLLQK